MTGQEFEVAAKAAGYSQSGVEPYWVYALAGLIASRAATSVSALVAEYDNAPAKMSPQATNINCICRLLRLKLIHQVGITDTQNGKAAPHAPAPAGSREGWMIWKSC